MEHQSVTKLNGFDGGDLSLVRFYNCYDLSDCTLEIVEEENTEEKLTVDCSVKEEKLVDKNNNENNNRFDVGKKEIDIERPLLKRRKLDKLSSPVTTKTMATKTMTTKTMEENNENNGKTILFIHSLLFCSNSEYFQKILMSGSRQRNVKIILNPGETEPFTRLIKLFYDERLIESLTVLETAQLLKFAKRFKCLNVCNKLLRHISSFKITKVSVLNQSIDVYSELLEIDDTNMAEIITRLKKSCLQYLKEYFCPVEKIFGPLLYDFLKLSFSSVYFFLNSIESGIAVCEDTVVGLVFYWLEYNSIMNTNHNPELAMKLFKRCRFEYVNISFIMDILCLPQPCWLSENYQEFYMHLLEYHACADKFSYFPDFPKRNIRCRNFAYDHEVFLYFAPVLSKLEGKNENEALLLTVEHNVIFVRGYQLHISAGAFQTDENRELRIKLSVENLNRMPHSQLIFSMLYTIASPSVSDQFSPWNHCTFLIDHCNKSSSAVISLIAKHSLINETGFYLKFYLE